MRDSSGAFHVLFSNSSSPLTWLGALTFTFILNVQRNISVGSMRQSYYFWVLMEDIDSSSLEVAKSSFLSLLSKVDPCESASFVEWVIQHCSDVSTTGNTGETTNYSSMTLAEKKLTEIVKDIKKRVPLQGIMASENISHPEEGEVTQYNQGLCPGLMLPLKFGGSDGH